MSWVQLLLCINNDTLAAIYSSAIYTLFNHSTIGACGTGESKDLYVVTCLDRYRYHLLLSSWCLQGDSTALTDAWLLKSMAN